MDDKGIQFWKIAQQLRKDNLQNSSILYTIPTNHNLTGITMSESRRKDLIDFCTANRLPIIEEGAYQELCYEGDSPGTNCQGLFNQTSKFLRKYGKRRLHLNNKS